MVPTSFAFKDQARLAAQTQQQALRMAEVQDPMVEKAAVLVLVLVSDTGAVPMSIGPT